MPVLTSELRRQLENVIIAARDQSESAARSALRKLGVDAAKPHEHFGRKEKALRNQLRARGRQAGDRREGNGSQEIEQLTQELAYEYWHRMLFARFLAENHLLMHPDGVAVSLSDCNELAAGEGVANGFMVAAKYASRMLPQIFRTDDVLLEIEFPANDRIPLEKLLASLPAQTFTADDSLGWVYQFWQSKRKDEVNAKGDKIDARSISAVTQLFTEHYMVLFLLHNTIGAWHAAKVLAANPTIAQSAANEEETRKAIALGTAGGYTFAYLRFVRGVDGTGGAWRPAAGSFEGWPKTAAELKMLDPCCGSGHFLVAGFELLVRLRMAEATLDLPAAIDAVLRDNLHGLELDPRCTQIAAFNLAIAAWKLGGYRTLPPMNIACTGIAPQGKKEDWIKLADSVPLRDRGPLRLGLGALYDTFTDAPILGSLIDPSSIRVVGAADFETLAPSLALALKAEPTDEGTGALDQRADAVTAQGLLKAAELLAGPESGYTLVITNVPYLSRKSHDAALMAWADDNAPLAKADLATMFLWRSFRWLSRHGTCAAVTPQNWLFLQRYTPLRVEWLEQHRWQFLLGLGDGAFTAITGAVVNVSLLIASRTAPGDQANMVCLDVASANGVPAKEVRIRKDALNVLRQEDQRANPDSRFSYGVIATGVSLEQIAFTAGGMCTFDNLRFIFSFWELCVPGGGWLLAQASVDETGLYEGRTDVVRWQGGKGELLDLVKGMEAGGYKSGIWRAGVQIWGMNGVLVRLMGSLPCTLYSGHPFNNNTGVIVPKDPALLPAIWAYCSSDRYAEDVRQLDRKMNVTNP